jgi:hypothetical protein
MVSPKPLSVFVPDVTLIAFPIPSCVCSRAVAEQFPRGKLIASRRESAPDSDLKANPGANPNSLWPRSNLRRFRPLFAAAQSTAPSKLANPLKSFGFLVLRQSAG